MLTTTSTSIDDVTHELMSEHETRNPNDLKPHPLNAKLYGEGPDEALRTSIEENRILTPLIITRDNTIISGHRRCAIAIDLGWEHVPVVVTFLDDPVEIEQALIEANVAREKTMAQKAVEYRELKRIHSALARRRQQQAAVQTNAALGRGQIDETLGENLPEATEQAGRARDIASKILGMSGKTAEAALTVLDVITEREAIGDTQAAQELRQRLNKSVNSAMQKARKEGWIADDTESDTRFNPTNESIDWAGWSWNPVTGCQHGCEYCYASTQAHLHVDKFPKGFEPHFRPERLDTPQRMRKPKGKALRDRTVFVCSMADLFGDWVNQEWIDAVLDAVRKAPEWNFIFLTKNPARLVGIDWPDNAWVGTTVDSQKYVAAAEAAFRQIKARVKFVSIEPFLEQITFTSLEMFNWVIIGGSTKQPNWPAQQPDWTWVTSLIGQAQQAKCQIYCKPNLHPVWPKDYPEYEEVEDDLAERLGHLFAGVKRRADGTGTKKMWDDVCVLVELHTEKRQVSLARILNDGYGYVDQLPCVDQHEAKAKFAELIEAEYLSDLTRMFQLMHVSDPPVAGSDMIFSNVAFRASESIRLIEESLPDDMRDAMAKEYGDVAISHASESDEEDDHLLDEEMEDDNEGDGDNEAAMEAARERAFYKREKERIAKLAGNRREMIDVKVQKTLSAKYDIVFSKRTIECYNAYRTSRESV